MRGSAIAASFALSLFALSASPVLAQTPAAPAKPAPAPAQPKPAAPPAAQAPAQPTPAPAAPPAQPPAPFPAGAKIAFFNPQAVFQASADGRAAVTRVNALIQKKQTENADKAKLLQGSVDAARASRPLDFAQFVAYGTVAAGWAALLTWKWEAVRAWLSGFTPAGIVTNAARAGSLSMSFFALVFVLASFTVMLALHTILAEE